MHLTHHVLPVRQVLSRAVHDDLQRSDTDQVRQVMSVDLKKRQVEDSCHLDL